MNNIKSGVYKITNIVSGKFYIGSSKDIDGRKNEHWQALRRGNHVNPILQHSWNYHGEDKFIFEIVEECPFDQCLVREQHYLDLLRPFQNIGYNIGQKAGGGDTFHNHPNKEAIREKTRQLNLGENNPMFGKTHSTEAIEKLKSKAAGRYSLEWFIERNGAEEGRRKYEERRVWLASRKINYSHDNGLKGKKVKVEATRGESVNRGRNALKKRREEFDVDIRSNVSSKEIADKYGVSVAAVKYHRKKL